MSVDKESPLLRKIRLLMAKAQGTSNEHEAAAFAAKVQELLLQNGLEMRDIAAEAPSGASEATVKPSDPLDFREFASPTRQLLLKQVCLFYMCDFIMWRKLKKIAIVGKPHNAEIALEMARYLVRESIRLSNAYSRKQSERIDFRRGCFARLGYRLQILRQDRERQAKSTNPGNLPVLFVGESQLVSNYMQNIRKARTGRQARLGIHAAHGARAAEDVSLQPQVRDSSQKHRRLA